jgi:hypothetical protein
LEHVPDDRKAMAELRRILRPSGMAIIMVPIEERLDETCENLSIVSEADRLIYFGQEDHVRYYSRSTARGGILDPGMRVERALRSQTRPQAWGTGFALHAGRVSRVAGRRS